jgi:hypothetical protein
VKILLLRRELAGLLGEIGEEHRLARIAVDRVRRHLLCEQRIPQVEAAGVRRQRHGERHLQS